MTWNEEALPALLGVGILVAVATAALAAQPAARSTVLSSVIERLARMWTTLGVVLVAAVLTAGGRLQAGAVELRSRGRR